MSTNSIRLRLPERCIPATVITGAINGIVTLQDQDATIPGSMVELTDDVAEWSKRDGATAFPSKAFGSGYQDRSETKPALLYFTG